LFEARLDELTPGTFKSNCLNDDELDEDENLLSDEDLFIINRVALFFL
jgi:hypothetical protein